LAEAEMSGDPATAEQARSILNELIRQRQDMRSADVEQGLLEANRLGIVYWQWQLSRALGGATRSSASQPPNPLVGRSTAGGPRAGGLRPNIAGNRR
jgi:hypothetical protein